MKFICGLNFLAVLHCGQQGQTGVNESRSRLFDFTLDGRGDDVVICS